ncbi:hypothetical protein EVAR_68469_1 [Eumeta japonica]|uniref:Uncharacterized protein n=1 Tax=Eumeta variegata TaxID=151549 RepID=A0A4C2A564_EUMVA|nr:hypothetical protein EVAR_68469_1 [Eumeta japonica]
MISDARTRDDQTRSTDHRPSASERAAALEMLARMVCLTRCRGVVGDHEEIGKVEGLGLEPPRRPCAGQWLSTTSSSVRQRRRPTAYRALRDTNRVVWFDSS